jgi:hypothetical protein
MVVVAPPEPSRAELILYATPVGPLADALEHIRQHLAAESPTTAQDYPPHCTLTGFFHRNGDDISRIRAELARTLTELGSRPDGAVRIVGLHSRTDWVGLELDSGWLEALAARFVELHRRGPDDDPIRPKDWLHLSIGYGIDDLHAVIEATADLDLSLPVDWEVALWQRHPDGSWSRESPGD